MPSVYDYNIRQFLSYVQADGYNQLTVANAFFKITDAYRVTQIVSQLVPPGPNAVLLSAMLSKPFRPGQLFKNITLAGIKISADRELVLNLVTKYAEQVPAGQYAQNGFWTDHFTYHMDLFHNFLAVYPDEKEHLLYDSDPVPFFLSPMRVTNRTEKATIVEATGKVRQLNHVAESEGKASELKKIYGSQDFVGDPSAGGVWQRTAEGETMKVSIITKLVVLAVTKFSIMDMYGMGVEMEGGKPGWNDAMNGLPALFGSEMPAAYELHAIVDFVGKAVDEFSRSTSLPVEIAALLTALDGLLMQLSAGEIGDFEYWDKSHTALEAYRWATDATFTGKTVSWSSAKLGATSGVFGKMLARMDSGIKKALTFAPDEGKIVSPTYFKFAVKSYVEIGKSGQPLAVDAKPEYEGGT